VDNLFIIARYFEREYGLKVTFLGEANSECKGAEGMLQAFSFLFVSQYMMQAMQEKLVGLSGEDTTSSCKSGLWMKLKDKI